jgi:hypothetical protein
LVPGTERSLLLLDRSGYPDRELIDIQDFVRTARFWASR